MSKVKIGLIGFGCVGQGIYQLINLLNVTQFQITRVAIKNEDKPRIIDHQYLTSNADELITDPSIDVIIEVIDDAEEAYRLVSEALKLGKTVITANKKMVANRLEKLLELEREYGGILLYEAAVCGAIPIIKTLNDLFSYENVSSIRGIFNGTSNFILSAIFNKKLSYDEALKDAQELGFAETNPESDVGGFDAKYKAVILAKHIFGVALDPDLILNYGIADFTQDDIRYARNHNFKIKLVPQLVTFNDQFAVFVLPQFVVESDRLYHVENELNGVLIEAQYSGTHFFNGKGAGSFPTAYSILNDLRDAAARKSYDYVRSIKQSTRANDDDVLVEIYLRYQNDEVKKALRFRNIREGFLDDNYKYIIGSVSLKSLLSNKKNILDDKASVIATGSVEYSIEGIKNVSTQLLRNEVQVN